MAASRQRVPWIVARQAETRSPLKSPPVRIAGQSVQEKMTRIRDDEFNDNLVLLFFAALLVVSATIQVVLDAPAGVILGAAVVVMVAAAIYAVPRMRRAQVKLRRLRLALDGERSVAEYLDTLQADGCRVLHDVRGANFNIDHVLIAPQGVFTIETKTLSKPKAGDARVHYDGERVRIGAYEPERNPITQARAQAAFLKQLLRDSTGKTYLVRSVVLFPGWYIHDEGSRKPGAVWVLEPKALGAFMQHEPATLASDDISLATFHLKRYVRASEPGGST